MIQSMTGYGKADAEFQGKKIHVEIKSLNSKALMRPSACRYKPQKATAWRARS